jgi:hypothetical protein
VLVRLSLIVNIDFRWSVAFSNEESLEIVRNKRPLSMNHRSEVEQYNQLMHRSFQTSPGRLEMLVDD